ncbi:MAG: hypothetical protein RIR90_618, partial [Bacteroidota bacterium]
IKAEVNVKELTYITDTEGVINKKIKANFKVLGAKLGAQMKEAAALIGQFTQHQIAELEKAGEISIQLSAGTYSLQLNEVEIVAEDIPGWSVASKGSLTVALDITLSESLKKEGDAREFINRVQNIRKEQGFELTDRIFVQVAQHEVLMPSINEFKDYICAEILADSIEFIPALEAGVEVEINDILLKVNVIKK